MANELKQVRRAANKGSVMGTGKPDDQTLYTMHARGRQFLERLRLDRIRSRGYHTDEVPYPSIPQ